MDRDDIIRLAREADPFGVDGRLYRMAELTPKTIERFAALVAAHEREACAQVCDEYAKNSINPMNFAENCAAAIRSRG